jgi:hypothetical protein
MMSQLLYPLSYSNGAAGRIRTCDHRVERRSTGLSYGGVWRLAADDTQSVKDAGVRQALEPAPRAATARQIRLTLDADDLLQGMYDFDQIGLRGHHQVDRLVGGRRFVDHRFVLAALDAGGRLDMFGQRHALLRFGA